MPHMNQSPRGAPATTAKTIMMSAAKKPNIRKLRRKEKSFRVRSTTPVRPAKSTTVMIPPLLRMAKGSPDSWVAMYIASSTRGAKRIASATV